jgi:hypothetical protein
MIIYIWSQSFAVIKNKTAGSNGEELQRAKPELFRLYENAVFRYMLPSTYFSVTSHTQHGCEMSCNCNPDRNINCDDGNLRLDF